MAAPREVKPPSVLTRMLRGQIPCERLLVTARFAAVLEPRPLTAGHLVVFPVRETDSLFELDDRTLQDLFVFAKKMARALRRAVPCLKIGAAVYGLKTRHAHVHLVPLHGRPGELDLSRPRKRASRSALRRVARAVRAAL